MVYSFLSGEKNSTVDKNLKGRECGKGICQRKDGLYSTRFVDKTGKRHKKYFQMVPKERNWIVNSFEMNGVI